MAIDIFTADHMAVADFGEFVTVEPRDGSGPFIVTMLFDNPADDAQFGMIQGNLQQPLFRCLPADGSRIAEGDTLRTGDGYTFGVFEVIARRNEMTQIRVKER